jgi:Tfp pilus assembly protein PilN
MKSIFFPMLRLIPYRFESQLMYVFWGAQNRLWMTVCKLAMLLVLCGWLLMTGMQVLKNQQTLQLLTSQEHELRKKNTDLKAKQKNQNQLPISVLSQVQILGYNSVIRQLNLPWKNLFDDLETLTPADVALLSIEPDGRRSIVKLVAEAKTLVTLLDYSAKLQQNGIFGRLTYSKHETNEQDSNKPVRLSFELELRTFPQVANMRASNRQILKAGQP